MSVFACLRFVSLAPTPRPFPSIAQLLPLSEGHDAGLGRRDAGAPLRPVAHPARSLGRRSARGVQSQGQQLVLGVGPELKEFELFNLRN